MMGQLPFLPRTRVLPELIKCGFTSNDDHCEAEMATIDLYAKVRWYDVQADSEHLEKVHVVPIRKAAVRGEALPVVKIGDDIVSYDTIGDLEVYVARLVAKTTTMEGAYPRSLRPQPLISGRLSPKPMTSSAILDMPEQPVPTYLVSCHEIQPSNAQGPPPHKDDALAPTIWPSLSSEPFIAAGKGLPHQSTVYLSSDFFPFPGMELDAEDGDDEAAYAASIAESSQGVLSGQPHARARARARSHSIVSDASSFPRQSQLPSLSEVAREDDIREEDNDREVADVRGEENTHAEEIDGEEEYVGEEENGLPEETTVHGHKLIRLTHPLGQQELPEGLSDPIPDTDADKVSLAIRPKTLIIHEILNPIQYAELAVRYGEYEAAANKEAQAMNDFENGLDADDSSSELLEMSTTSMSESDEEGRVLT